MNIFVTAISAYNAGICHKAFYKEKKMRQNAMGKSNSEKIETESLITLEVSHVKNNNNNKKVGGGGGGGGWDEANPLNNNSIHSKIGVVEDSAYCRTKLTTEPYRNDAADPRHKQKQFCINKSFLFTDHNSTKGWGESEGCNNVKLLLLSPATDGKGRKGHSC